MAPTLLTQHLVLRPARDSDVAVLTQILAEPEVARWWHGFDAARVRAELLEPDDVTVFVIERDGVVAGAIQYGEEEDPMYRHASIDVFLSAAARGVGLGPEAIRAVVDLLVMDRGHHRIVIDPAAENVRAIRAYEKVGFRPVGVMRRYERGADGTWHDGLLMDYLADEARAFRVRSARTR